MIRTWKTCADEFALLDRHEGWPFALLVACSVRAGAGDPSSPEGGATEDAGLKVSANRFGQHALTAHTRVLRYLKAWNAAADEGLVPHSDTLVPSDAPATALPAADWRAFYQPTLGRNREYARRNKALIEAVTEEQREAMRAAAAESDRVTRAERLVTRAAELIAEERSLKALTDAEEQAVQKMALHLLEALDKETTVAFKPVVESFAE